MPAAHTIPVLCKALSVLRVLSNSRGATSTKSIALELGISHSTAYRILQTFIAEDWVRPVSGGRHELSLGLLPLLQPLVRHELLIELVREPLKQLAAQTGLTAKLSVRQGDHAITLHRAESLRPAGISVKIGTAFHLSLGSSGAVLLAAMSAAERKRILAQAPADCWLNQSPADVEDRLRELARCGHCIDHGQYRQKIAALSAPLKNHHDDTVASITLVGFPEDLAAVIERRRLARHLRATADVCRRAFAKNNPS